jgi:Mn-dependent DtxR family transcriptional regulator
MPVTPAALTQEELSAINTSVSWLDQNVGFVNNETLHYFLNQNILTRLKTAAVASMMNQYEKDNLANLSWQIYVLNTSQKNAFSIGNGVIILSKGLLLTLNSESEVASIVAHEMSHQILGETQKALVDSIRDKKAQAFFFPIKEELTADKLTLSILYNANYTPSATINAYQLAYRSEAEMFSGNSNEVNNTILKERLEAIQEALQKHGLSSLLPRKESTKEWKAVQAGIKK